MAAPLADQVAIVTGGARGLGRAMTLGLARAGATVVAVGHIEDDLAPLAGDARDLPGRVLPVLADLRRPAECDRVVALARQQGGVPMLVNNAGLTFTTITPDKFRRSDVQRFYEVNDAIVQAVMDTNYMAADQLARRVAPLQVEAGWGRIVNV